MRLGRWFDSVCQENEVMRKADANETSGPLARVVGRQQHETSGKLRSAFVGILVGVSQLRIP